MQAISIPTDEQGFDAWLAESDPHVIAHALNRAPAEPRAAAFRSLPSAKALRILGLLEPPNQADVLDAAELREMPRKFWHGRM